MFTLASTPNRWVTGEQWPRITEIEKAAIGLIHDSECSEYNQNLIQSTMLLVSLEKLFEEMSCP